MPCENHRGFAAKTVKGKIVAKPEHRYSTRSDYDLLDDILLLVCLTNIKSIIANITGIILIPIKICVFSLLNKKLYVLPILRRNCHEIPDHAFREIDLKAIPILNPA